MPYSKTFFIKANDYNRAGTAASEIKKIMQQKHLPPTLIRRVSIACYEAEMNMVIHSKGGFLYALIHEGDVELLFKDEGPGIRDIDQALQPGFSTADEIARSHGFGAGMGLPNMKASSDQFMIESTPKGTTLVLRFSQREGD